MSNADELVVKIGADFAELNREFKKAGGAAKEFDSEFKKAGRGFQGTSDGMLTSLKKTGEGVASLGAKFAGIAAPILAAGAAAIYMGKQFNDAARETKFLSERVGVSAEKFSQLEAVSKKFGATSEDVYDVFKDLNVRITDASMGAQGYEDALNKIGLSYKNLIHLSPEEQVYALSDALSTASGEAQRFALDELVSDPGLRMIGVLKQGSGALKEMMQSAADAGNALSKADFDRFEQLNQSFNDLSVETSTLGKNLTQFLAPALSEAARIAGALAADMNKLFEPPSASKSAAIEELRKIEEQIIETQAKIKHWENELAQGASIFGPSSATMKRTIKRNENNLAALEQQARRLRDIAITGPEQGAANAPSDYYAPPKEKDDMMLQNIVGYSPKAAGPEEGTPQQIAEAQMLADQEYSAFLTSELELRLEENRAYYEQIGYNQAMYNAELLENERRTQDATRMMWESGLRGKLQIARGMMSDLSSLMNSESRKMFEVGKAAATATAIIDTISSAQKSFNALAGIPIVGPALGAAAAGAAILAGMARVQQIQSTTFGGGGGGAGGGGAGGGVAGTPQPQEVIQTTNVDVNLQGDQFSGAQVRGLIGEINAAVSDGAKLNAIRVR